MEPIGHCGGPGEPDCPAEPSVAVGSGMSPLPDSTPEQTDEAAEVRAYLGDNPTVEQKQLMHEALSDPELLGQFADEALDSAE